MPDFILRRNSVVRVYPHDFDVILILQDGFELRAGKIAEQTGARMQVYWAWGALPRSHGRSETREEAMAAFRTAWGSVTPEQIGGGRREQEWTANKYAL
jgi:hypothetical protein